MNKDFFSFFINTFSLFFEILEILTEATGAFEEFFSSLYIFAFSATNDLFF